MHITASKIYNYLQCPHRVWRDAHGPQDEKSKETDPFVQLLWDRGIQHEKGVIAKLGEFTDLSEYDFDIREKKTLEAVKRGDELIYQPIFRDDKMLGIPDLIRRNPDGSYIPIDIKSGMGQEGASDENKGKMKKHYALQLCVYIELLKKHDLTNRNVGLIIDINGEEVEYNLDEQASPRLLKSWWQVYNEVKEEVLGLLANRKQNSPANSSTCKLCPWCASCKKWCKENDDLTNIFYLGRSKRNIISEHLGVSTVKDICALDIEEIKERKKKDKTFLSGIGEKTIEKIITRADIIANNKKPVIYNKISFPEVSTELFFDIEADPTQNLVYLHGVYERKNGKERFLNFIAKSNNHEAEKEAWQEFWQYIRSLPEDDYAVYYYAPYERVVYKKMQQDYPDVATEEEVDNFFKRENTIDLYTDIICKHTDWPLGSYSLKEIAMYLGFKWRDETPSGALSIQWYNKYLETKDKKVLKRILEYNEDDCKATMVVKDAIQKMSN